MGLFLDLMITTLLAQLQGLNTQLLRGFLLNNFLNCFNVVSFLIKITALDILTNLNGSWVEQL